MYIGQFDRVVCVPGGVTEPQRKDLCPASDGDGYRTIYNIDASQASDGNGVSLVLPLTSSWGDLEPLAARRSPHLLAVVCAHCIELRRVWPRWSTGFASTTISGAFQAI